MKYVRPLYRALMQSKGGKEVINATTSGTKRKIQRKIEREREKLLVWEWGKIMWRCGKEREKEWIWEEKWKGRRESINIKWEGDQKGEIDKDNKKEEKYNLDE